jgi:DNA-binding NarL/FixJ family response regulator
MFPDAGPRPVTPRPAADPDRRRRPGRPRGPRRPARPELRDRGTAADTDEAIALAAEHRPDIALVDVEMPGGGGPRATREISAASPATAIVALSADESDRVVRDMLGAGAVAYIRKGVSVERLTALLHESARARARLPDAG